MTLAHNAVANVHIQQHSHTSIDMGTAERELHQTGTARGGRVAGWTQPALPHGSYWIHSTSSLTLLLLLQAVGSTLHHSCIRVRVVPSGGFYGSDWS